MVLILSIGIASIAVFVCILIKKKLNYFSDRGLPYMSTTISDQLKCLSFVKNFNFVFEIYDKYKQSDKGYIGYFSAFLTPSFVLLDNKLIETIFIKDFSHFHDHGFDFDLEINPLFGHLFVLKGDQWRALRNKLLPAFTSGKLKGMIPAMEQCAENLLLKIQQNSDLRCDVDLQIFKDYTLDVIAICTFGLDLEHFKDPNSNFKKFLGEFLTPSIITQIKMALIILLPKVAKFLKIKLGSKESENFFLNLTREAFEIRKTSGVKRNDFIQLLLELKDKGSVEVDTKDLEEDEKESIKEMQNHTLTKLELTHEVLTAQALVFLTAGFENSAYVAQITAYFLSKNPDIQERVRDEIKQMKNKHGKIDYMCLRDMKLLSACVDESLRLHSPTPFLMRQCTKTYTVGNGEIIEKGRKLMIPAHSIHNDGKYWTNPEKFNPDRFIQNQALPGTYLPFGDGPRICIAQRLALVMSKMLLAKLVEKFYIKPSSKTQEPIRINPSRGSEIVGGIWANLEEIE